MAPGVITHMYSDDPQASTLCRRLSFVGFCMACSGLKLTCFNWTIMNAARPSVYRTWPSTCHRGPSPRRSGWVRVRFAPGVVRAKPVETKRVPVSARVGQTFCPNCGTRVRKGTVDEVAARLIELPAG